MANLFINACVRKESRTIVIARDIINKMKMSFVEINLEKEKLKPLTEKRLKKRDFLIKTNNFSDKSFTFAKQFAEAENIIIAAPYWDLSFPAILKTFIENICVSNITFKYTENGLVGLCKAKKLTYVTTAGGNISVDFGYSYIKALAKSLFGIENTVCYKAEDLDVKNIQPDKVLEEVKIIEIK